ncbi:hypothetical protein STIAU_4822 [Stigmatella aurantiaca DW4/3-1]|uniref:Uncharacterized protein n=1 Tax=Stigmatella aurantiaca (strain DW4/3-1) TaxID=378806 RepID=Q08ZW4_STIAD|nr:hypothetical protein STIAU_4822 [Stigmatella aurantiaca DW4/3-1]
MLLAQLPRAGGDEHPGAEHPQRLVLLAARGARRVLLEQHRAQLRVLGVDQQQLAHAPGQRLHRHHPVHREQQRAGGRGIQLFQQPPVPLAVRDEPPQGARVRGCHQARGPIDDVRAQHLHALEARPIEGELLDDEALGVLPAEHIPAQLGQPLDQQLAQALGATRIALGRLERLGQGAGERQGRGGLVQVGEKGLQPAQQGPRRGVVGQPGVGLQPRVLADLLVELPRLEHAVWGQVGLLLEEGVAGLVLGGGGRERREQPLGRLPELAPQLRAAAGQVAVQIHPVAREDELELGHVGPKVALDRGGQAQLGEGLLHRGHGLQGRGDGRGVWQDIAPVLVARARAVMLDQQDPVAAPGQERGREGPADLAAQDNHVIDVPGWARGKLESGWLRRHAEDTLHNVFAAGAFPVGGGQQQGFQLGWKRGEIRGRPVGARLAEQLRGGGGRDAHRHHPRRPGRANAVQCVLEDDTGGGLHAQAPRGGEEDVGGGLAVDHLLRTHHPPERAPDAQPIEHQLAVGRGGSGGHGEVDPGGAQPGDELLRPPHERQVRGVEPPVVVLFLLRQLVQFLGGHVPAEEQREDLLVLLPSELALEALGGGLHPQPAGEGDPRLGVEAHVVDEGAIHVEDGGEQSGGRGHAPCLSCLAGAGELSHAAEEGPWPGTGGALSRVTLGPTNVWRCAAHQ